MASRYFSKLRPIGKPGIAPSPGKDGAPGAEAAKMKVRERTADWPDPGPHWKGSFNSMMKSHVVKTTAKKGGLEA